MTSTGERLAALRRAYRARGDRRSPSDVAYNLYLAVLAAPLVAFPIACLWTIFNQPGRTALVPGNRVAEVGTILLLALGLLVARRLRGRALWLVALVVSGCMAVMRALGAHWNKVAAQPYRPFTRWLPLELAVDWLVMLIGCAAALVVLQWCRRPRSGVRPTVRFWLVAVGVQLICWLPYELVYWPGIVGRDSWSSIIMGIGREQMSNHHPVLFSLWVGFCVRLARVFGGEVTQRFTYGESPMAAECGPDVAGHVMHSQLEIPSNAGGNAMLMGADGPPPHAAAAPA